ncbi:MAG: type II toxin-antitoxin system VapC family toxin [Thiolinea sp.]
MQQVLLDTDIAIWLLRKQEEHVQTFLDAGKLNFTFLLSPIVSAEIYAGAFKHEYPTIEEFFSLLTHLTLDIETGRLAGEFAYRYRKAYNKISLEDYLLAATAVKEDLLLWTGNHKHYPMPEVQFFNESSLANFIHE